jgi:hypothetical protein
MLDELAIALMVETWDIYRATHGCPDECPFGDLCRMNEPDRRDDDRVGLCLPVSAYFIAKAKTLRNLSAGRSYPS